MTEEKELMIIERVEWLDMYRAVNTFEFNKRRYYPGELVSLIELDAYLKNKRDEK